MKKYSALILLLFISAAACRKPDQYPVIPTLAYKSLTFSKDQYGSQLYTLTATFTDGDGDIGYNQGDFSDPSSPYYSNFVITLQRFHQGKWTDTIHFHYLADTINQYDSIFPISCRIPYLTPEGQNKGLKGDVEKTGDLPLGLNDTIRFTAFLYDRALHKSNVIIVPADGGYFITTK